MLISSPYTSPVLQDASNKYFGYVIYGENFACGRMPNKDYIVPLDWQTKWYPCAFHQAEALEAIVNCGPWMPRDNEAKSWQLGLGYKFKFKLGGVLPPGQPPVDPCKRPTHELPDPSPVSGSVQVRNPSQVGADGYPWHPWDIRRGLFSGTGFKRMLQYQTDDDTVSEPAAKLPRHDPPWEGAPTTWSSAPHLQALLQKTPGAVPFSSPQEGEPEEEQTPSETQLQRLLQRELEQQREQQRLLKQGLKEMFSTLQLTQQGYHIDTRLL